jgi:Zn-dependent protease/CBS domain-containing protein
MRWSWKIGRFAGIDVYIHATFLLLIAWVIGVHWIADHSFQGAGSGVLFILVLFACVVFHEFGHALTARHYGIPTKDITLLPIGGVSRFERLPDKPRQEFWVSLAGPLVNVVIGIALLIALFFAGGFRPVTNLTLSNGPFLERMMIANFGLAVFNVIPAFPMDGGRILRALLSTRMDHVHATQAAAAIGQGLALIFGLLGLFYDPFLLFIALFVWIGAAHESQSVQIKEAFTGIPIRNVMQTHFATLSTAETLGDAAKLMLDGSQHDFPVMWGEKVMGILGRSNLLAGLQEFGPEERVTQVMQREFSIAAPGEMMEPVLVRLAGSPARAIPVLDDGQLVGLVTLEHLGEYLMVQNALHRRQSAPPRTVNRAS